MALLSRLTPPWNEFDSTIQKILSSPQYKHLSIDYREFLDRLNEAASKFLLKLINKLYNTNVGSIPRGVSTAFMLISILAAIAIIVFAAVKIVRAVDKKNTLKEIMGEKITEKTTPRSLKNKAEGYWKTEDYRNGVRYDFIALLFLMHERNILYLEHTKTNYEIYKFLNKQNFSNIESFKILSDIFNESWYGDKQLNAEGCENWSTNINHLWNEVIRDEEKKK